MVYLSCCFACYEKSEPENMKILKIFKRKTPDPSRRSSASLITHYREALSACKEIETHTEKTKTYLAGMYMKYIVSESDEWKKENEAFLFEPFFVYDYLAEKGVIGRKETEPMILHPDGERETGMSEIKIISSIENPDTGRIEVRPVFGDSPAKALWGMGFEKDDEKYVCVISDREAPLMDRAAEAGAMLIDRNIGVCVFNAELFEKIYARDYASVNRYRVFAPEDDREIAFAYPWNPALHRSLFRSGAKWNGRYVSMPLAGAEKIQDLILMYGFYIEPRAAKRMEDWLNAEKYARTMPKNREILKEEEELVSRFLSRPIEIIEDLKDE